MKHWLHRVITEQEKGPHLQFIRWVLWIFSVIYGALVTWRNDWYKKRIFQPFQFSFPIISVGNLTVGGVGKTPLVEFIARYYSQELHLHPAILMRGYMDHAAMKSDEAEMLREHLPNIPILVGANRIQQAEIFLQSHQADVFILDDGFQHRRLKRDLDIVVIDSTNPFGNGYLLPRGILREPLNELKRADLIILTKTDLVSDVTATINQIKHINAVAPVIQTIHQPTGLRDLRCQKMHPLTHIRQQTIASCSAIGNPVAFEKMLAIQQATLCKAFPFPDHYTYERKDILLISDFCKNNQITSLITTDKDAGKLSPFLSLIDSSIDVLSMCIEIKFKEGRDIFCDRIRSILFR